MTIHLATSTQRIIGVVAGAWIGVQLMVLIPSVLALALVPLLGLAGLTGPVMRRPGVVLAVVGSTMAAHVVLFAASLLPISPVLVLPVVGVAALGLAVVLTRSIRVVSLALVKA